MAISERDIMGGLAKGLAVIETFTAERPRQSIAEVSAASGLDRATARRCLLTLAYQGYADYDGKFFTLTPRILRLGTACLATMPLPQIVQPMLDRLSEEIGESSSVCILDGSEIVYVARAAQRKVMSVVLMPGSRLPAYCTSMGRMLLSGLAADDLKSFLTQAAIERRTPKTITGRAALGKAIDRARAEGFAIVDEELELGLRSIAVPIVDRAGRTVAAINVSTQSARFSVEAMERDIMPVLRNAKQRVEEFFFV